MEISVNKLRPPWRNVKAQELSDGTAIIIKYAELKNELVELSPYSTYYDRFDSKTFLLKVNVPERSIEHIIHIIKTSVNRYRVIYSNCRTETKMLSFNNYDVINEFLATL